MASVFQIMGGIAGTIMQVVTTIVLGGFLEFLNSSKPPSGQADFSLLMQPFALRSPPKDSACSFNPQAEGGVENLVSQFTSRSLGGSGLLLDIAQGRNPPPPAPPALAAVTAAQEQALDELLVEETKQRKLIYWSAGIGLAAVGGAVLWKYLR
jgi:hypothetical protein